MITEEEEERKSNNGRNILVFGRRLFERREDSWLLKRTYYATVLHGHGGEERGHCERDEGVGRLVVCM